MFVPDVTYRVYFRVFRGLQEALGLSKALVCAQHAGVGLLLLVMYLRQQQQQQRHRAGGEAAAGRDRLARGQLRLHGNGQRSCAGGHGARLPSGVMQAEQRGPVHVVSPR